MAVALRFVLMMSGVRRDSYFYVVELVVAVASLLEGSDWLRVFVAHPFVTFLITSLLLMVVYLFVCGIIGLLSTALKRKQRTRRQSPAESSRT